MAKAGLERDLVALAMLRDSTRRQIYLYVSKKPGSTGRVEVATALEISRPLAAFHLDRLVAAGLLQAHYRRLSGRVGPGAGRSSKLYRRAGVQFDVTLPHRQYKMLAELMADAIQQREEVTAVALRRGESLGGTASRRLRRDATGQKRWSCFVNVLEALGYDPFPERDRLRLRNCPFHPLSKRQQELVCETNLALIAGLINGARVEGVSPAREDRSGNCCVVIDNVRHAE